MNDLSGYTYRYAIRWYVLEHNGSRTDGCPIPYMHRTQNTGVAANVDSIADDWKFLIMVRSHNAKRRVLTNLAIVANRTRMQNHASMMPNPYTSS